MNYDITDIENPLSWAVITMFLILMAIMFTPYGLLSHDTPLNRIFLLCMGILSAFGAKSTARMYRRKKDEEENPHLKL